MDFKRYIVKFGKSETITALEGRYHCAGLPKDPYDIENAMLMSAKALEVFKKKDRFARAVPIEVIEVTCSIKAGV